MPTLRERVSIPCRVGIAHRAVTVSIAGGERRRFSENHFGAGGSGGTGIHGRAAARRYFVASW